MVSQEEFAQFKSYIEQQFVQANEVTINSKAELQAQLTAANDVYVTSAADMQNKFDQAENHWNETDVTVTQKFQAHEMAQGTKVMLIWFQNIVFYILEMS